MTTPTETPREPESNPAVRSGLTRRKLVAGTVAAGVTGASIFHIAGAQDDAGTPDATTGKTPASGTPNISSDQPTESAEAAFATEALARADEMIASVQADRDAVAAGIDTTEVDSLIAQAGIHRDLTQAAIDASDTAEAIRQAFVATGSARAARQLIQASLGYAGLPSQKIRASRILARVHEVVTTVTTDAASATDPNVTSFVTHAQTAYTTAYDLYGTGAFGQAIGTGHVAGELARIATLLMVDVTQVGQGGMLRGGMAGRLPGGGRRGNDRRGGGFPGMGGPGGMAPAGDDGSGLLDGDDSGDPEATPETVPASDF